jgi:hypothetical protein
MVGSTHICSDLHVFSQEDLEMPYSKKEKKRANRQILKIAKESGLVIEILKPVQYFEMIDNRSLTNRKTLFKRES